MCSEEGVIAAQPSAVVELGGATFTLLGTAHVSRTSAETVRQMIDSGEFDAVAIELDAARYGALTNPERWSQTDLMKVLREGKAGMLAVNLALAAFQQRLADQFGIEPGAEMRAAIEATKRHRLPLLLIDREIGTTLRRVYANVPWWQRLTLASGLLASSFSRDKIDEEEIERLKEGDILESTFNEFAERSEKLYIPLIRERDEYMAAQLRRQVLTGGEPRHRRVLVVIGAGHLKGMSQHLSAAPEPAAADAGGRIAELERTPPPSQLVRALPWLILALVAFGFVLGFMRSPDVGLSLLADWSLITAALAAVGTAAALAHPLTVLATAVAAPFTTLNPLIGAGFVAAGVELWLRKPSVGDFEALRKDVGSWRGWWRNGAARILLVFVLSTLGAATGTWVAGARIFGRLFGGG